MGVIAMAKRSHESMSSASDYRSSAGSCLRFPGADYHGGHIAKSVAIEKSESPMMQCSLPPHATTLEFTSLEAFETHYTKEHTNRCISCGKNFPSAQFLALHQDETHNPMREILASKGEKTYSCFVDDCDKKCSNPTKRRLHLIDKHNFPKFYNFRVVDTGIDNSTSLLKESHRRHFSMKPDRQSTSQVRTCIPTTPHLDVRGSHDAEHP